MSKRHRKTKHMMSSFDDDYETMLFEGVNGDFGYMETPRGKKPRGKHKRQSVKRAYYDD